MASPDPRLELLGIPDRGIAREAMQFYQSLPDTAFLQARGMIPPPQPMGAPPGSEGYVDPFAAGAVADPRQQMRAYEEGILGGMSKIDATAPDYDMKLQQYFAEHPDPYATQYPRVQAAIGSSLQTHRELQSIFQKSPKLRGYYQEFAKNLNPAEAVGFAQEIAANEPTHPTLRGVYHSKIGEMLKGKKVVDPADVASQIAMRYELSMAGVDPSGLDRDGVIDPFEGARALARAKAGAPVMRPITDTEEKTLSKFMDEVDAANQFEPDIKAKKSLVDSGKAKDWDDAYEKLKKAEIERARTALRRKVQSYDASNIAVPPDYYEAAGLPPRGYTFNQKGKPVREGEAVQPDAGAPVTPVTPSPAVRPTSAPKSIYDVPSAAQVEAGKKAGEAAQAKSAAIDMQGAIEEGIMSHYAQAGRDATDAAHDLDRLLLEIGPSYGVGSGEFEHAYRGDLKIKDLFKDYLIQHDLPATPNTLRALDAILAKRQAATAAPAAGPKPPAIKSIKLIQK